MLALTSFEADVAGYFFGTLAAGYDLRPRLGEIGVPTLAVVGGYDWVYPPAAGRAIADGIPGAELVELADSGHFGFSEEPARFQAAVRAFLGRLDRRPELASASLAGPASVDAMQRAAQTTTPETVPAR